MSCSAFFLVTFCIYLMKHERQDFSSNKKCIIYLFSFQFAFKFNCWNEMTQKKWTCSKSKSKQWGRTRTTCEKTAAAVIAVVQCVRLCCFLFVFGSIASRMHFLFTHKHWFNVYPHFSLNCFTNFRKWQPKRQLLVELSPQPMPVELPGPQRSFLCGRLSL